MVVVCGQVDDDVIPFIVCIDGVEAEVRVSLIPERKLAPTCKRFDKGRTLYLATTPPASLSIT